MELFSRFIELFSRDVGILTYTTNQQNNFNAGGLNLPRHFAKSVKKFELSLDETSFMLESLTESYEEAKRILADIEQVPSV